MRYAALTAAAAALLVASSALVAQEGTPASDSQNQVYIDVDGAAVQVPVALAAEACGLDEAAVMKAAAARLEEAGPEASATSDATAPANESNETVTPTQGAADPSTSNPGDEMLFLAVCRIDVATAGDLGIPQANEIVTE